MFDFDNTGGLTQNFLKILNFLFIFNKNLCGHNLPKRNLNWEGGARW